jgi:hypothetical protein
MELKTKKISQIRILLPVSEAGIPLDYSVTKCRFPYSGSAYLETAIFFIA